MQSLRLGGLETSGRGPTAGADGTGTGQLEGEGGGCTVTGCLSENRASWKNEEDGWEGGCCMGAGDPSGQGMGGWAWGSENSKPRSQTQPRWFSPAGDSPGTGR